MIVKSTLYLKRGSRSFTAPDWESTGIDYLKTWREAGELLKNNIIHYNDVECIVNIDLDSIVGMEDKQFENEYIFWKLLTQGINPIDHISVDDDPVEVRIEVEGDITGKDDDHRHAIARTIVDCFVIDMFLIMNIAMPGSMNLYKSKIDDDEFESTSYSNTLFELSLINYQNHKWPLIRKIPLREVVAWFRSVRPGVSQVPHNPMERALFALLHLSKSDASPLDVIWLFYAFEGLLQTNIGENFSALIRRFEMILSCSKRESSALKKLLRSLYDVRSSIVHGGLSVLHPLAESLIDPEVDILR